MQLYPKSIIIEGFGTHYSGEPATFATLKRACELGQPVELLKEDEKYYYVNIDGIPCQFQKHRFQLYSDWVAGGKKDPEGYKYDGPKVKYVDSLNTPASYKVGEDVNADPFDDDPFND